MPKKPGVYFFLDKTDSVLYIGKAKNLLDRVSSYFAKPDNLSPKTYSLVTQIVKIKVIIVESELESLLLEANYIKKFKPKYNIKLIDNKAYPLIRINKNAQFPSLTITRNENDPKSIYFGPYPDSKGLRQVLRMIRKIFPYQSVLNHPKKTCLYYHLNLCSCPPVFNSPYDKKQYKKAIAHIIDFLNGKTKKVVSDLEKERNLLSSQEEFEKAAKTQIKIDLIHKITQPFHMPFEYETNPNLRIDLRTQELEELMQVLKNNQVNVSKLNRIECYDISNTFGKNPTGSMVVLTNGEIDKSQYRKFSIKTQGPNDFAMMEEMLSRRFKNDWQLPDLLIVDGGKGQITAAKKILVNYSLNIPLIGLAKREETIITSDFKEIRLPKDSKALQIVMRLRDEAHRFAITYHKKLRSKFTFE